ncbi:MAG: amidohydrolase family protein [Pseudomonadota bacterium]
MIDAHQHFWRIGQNDCTWPTPDLAAIHRDFLPSDLKPLAKAAGVTGVVLVQSQPSDRDTDWLLELARADDLILGVVGWVDFKAADAPARIAQLAAAPKLRGLRPMLQGLPEDDWILDPAAAPGLEAMIAAGVAFDALIFTRHLRHIRVLARRYPELRIVIDHGAKPPIAAEAFEPWAGEIAETAKAPNIFCKLSGLLTESRADQRPDALARYITHLFGCFGAERLVWGSDWPVLNLAGDYAGWLEFALTQCRALNPGAEGAVFGENARRFYGLAA